MPANRPWMSALLVHGAGGGAWEWNVWRGVLLAHGIKAHAIELQPVAAEHLAAALAATSLNDYQQQVRAALSRLPRPRLVMGASLGGLLAMHVAHESDALILINPLPPAPWHLRRPPRDWTNVVPWQRNARLQGSRAALADADDASALFAFRHWRDESGRVMREACAGVQVAAPTGPVLMIVSSDDRDVKPEISRAIAQHWNATLLEAVAASHVGPLLGRRAPDYVRQAVAWLNQVRSTVRDSDVVDRCTAYDASAPVERPESTR